MTHQILLIIASCILAGAALQDLMVLRISNIFPLALVALFLAWLATIGWEWSVWQNVACFAGALGIGTLLFAKGWMGGGDTKLFAAAALWFAWPSIIALLVYVSLSGAVLTFVLFGLRRLIPKAAKEGWNVAIFGPKGPIPYGVAIAIGAILTLFGPGPNPSGIVHMPDFIAISS